MDVYEVIENIEELIDGAFTIPIINRVMVNRTEVMEAMNDLRLKLPEDLKVAKRVAQDRMKILTEAHQEAQNIIKGTEEQIMQMVNEHEIVKKAYEQANELVDNAKNHARDIRLGSREWADKHLAELESRLIEQQSILIRQIEAIREGRSELKKQ